MLCYECQKKLTVTEAFAGVKILDRYTRKGLKKYIPDMNDGEYTDYSKNIHCFVQGYHKDLLALIDANFKSCVPNLPASSDYLYTPIVCSACVLKQASLEGINLE